MKNKLNLKKQQIILFADTQKPKDRDKDNTGRPYNPKGTKMNENPEEENQNEQE